MLTLRPKQSALVDAIRVAYRSHRSVLAQAPTGFGKTILFSYMAQRLVATGKTVVILVHRDELVEQVSETLLEFDVPHSFIAANLPYDRQWPVQVASVFTLAKRLERMPAPSMVIIDEAHHAIAGSTWGRVLAHWPQAYRLGVTATPLRLSGEGLSDLFDTMVLGPTTRELIDGGDLCDYRLFMPHTIDTSGVHRRGGDFVRSELADLVDRRTITGNAVTEYRRRADGKRAVAFCVSVAHAHHVAEEFKAHGYRAACIDGKMDRDYRRQVVRDFRTGVVQVLTSCDLISEGFNLPAIECGIFLRPTHSLGLWLQQVGRCLRVYDGKDRAVLLDHASNTAMHGLPDDPRAWSLEGGERRQRDTEAPIRQCPRCYAVSSAAAAQCRHCGLVFQTTPREIAQVEGTLEEVDAEALRRARIAEQSRARTFEELVQVGRQRGYKAPEQWAKHVWAARLAKQAGAEARRHITGGW